MIGPQVTNRTTLKRHKRKKRKGDYTCLCPAYTFPHRMFGGECEGALFVRTYFDRHLYAGCRDCHFRIEETEYDSRRGGITCQVLDGLEPYLACPELQEFVRYESIKLYGKAATIMRKK